jgi:hypothetical protein
VEDVRMTQRVPRQPNGDVLLGLPHGSRRNRYWRVLAFRAHARNVDCDRRRDIQVGP